MWRIVDIASNDRHLGLKQNHIIIYEKKTELGRVFLPDVCALLIQSHQVTISKNIIIACAEQGVPIVFCDKRHNPVSIALPVSGHYHIAKRVADQIQAGRSLKKRMWKQIVRVKIREQARTLEQIAPNASRSLAMLEKSVRSGDPENREAQAARIYWRQLFGKGFTRDRNSPGLNAGLNYGYTIIRSAMARAVATAGLLPSVGLHHHNQLNAFCLVDDLMEPYRPLVDRVVYGARPVFEADNLTAGARASLGDLVNQPLSSGGEEISVQRTMQTTCLSLVRVFEGSQKSISFPVKLEVVKQSAFGV